MSTTRRIIIAIVIIAAVVGAILVIHSSRRGGYLYRAGTSGDKEFTEGCVPFLSGGELLANFCQKNTTGLAKAGFKDKAENKLQEGWLLRDVLLKYIKEEQLSPDTMVVVSSSSRGKKAGLTWKDISNEKNKIILALSRQGSLKLVSTMKDLDTREKWVQDIDRIEILKK
ncbi:MAG TPA: hypothetical protein PLM53_18055 [Spirochaetota bacterium]|nr:hypothetical protein [Spirochaetota bacterium]HPL18157.1 hypothetical protein [Spirochaetota bacterium]HQF08367.1 hypothetical protein [Spirochaetota bacterium]HQH99004.1 hypothetical protein [Spirochaetota bacterium]HRS78956.1 hypothetical protein [Spirochaetota bacterium]